VGINGGAFSLDALDALSYQDSWIHRLDPRTKVLAALGFVVTVVSFPKYEIAGLLPLFLFPAVILRAAKIPVWLILKRVLIVSIFAVFVGLFNPLLDRHLETHVLGIPITGGWLSLISILLKSFLTLSAVLLLIATTSFPRICHALRQLGLPEVFVVQLLFLYRYLFVLMDETTRMVRARELRSFGTRGFEMNVFVHFIGTLLIRSMERAERIYEAMLSRGFQGKVYPLRESHLTLLDGLSLGLTLGGLILFRRYDVVERLSHHLGQFFS
jgi:cobalt/nickel transport system permease protein